MPRAKQRIEVDRMSDETWSVDIAEQGFIETTFAREGVESAIRMALGRAESGLRKQLEAPSKQTREERIATAKSTIEGWKSDYIESGYMPDNDDFDYLIAVLDGNAYIPEVDDG